MISPLEPYGPYQINFFEYFWNFIDVTSRQKFNFLSLNSRRIIKPKFKSQATIGGYLNVKHDSQIFAIARYLDGNKAGPLFKLRSQSLTLSRWYCIFTVDDMVLHEITIYHCGCVLYITWWISLLRIHYLESYSASRPRTSSGCLCVRISRLKTDWLV